MTQPRQPAELVFAYLFSGDGVGRLLDADAALEWLKLPAHPGEYIWLHFNSPHGIGERWLQYVELSMAFKDTMHEERRSSRLARGHQGLFAVMNDVNYDAATNKQLEVATLWISIRQRWLLSTWDKPLRSVAELIKLIKSRHSFPGPLSLVTQLLSEQAEVLMQIVHNVALSANDIEAQLSANKLPKRSSLGHIRRDLIRLQRLLAPEPASVFRIVNRPPKWAREEELDRLHLATEDFVVAMRDMVNLLERIRLLEEDIAARVGEKSNRSLFILTSVTVISLPMTVVGALFGMNVGGLPFRNSDAGFWVLFAISIGMTLMASWLVLKLLREG